jgi:uncharacterized protein (TIGR03435 family)
MDSEPYDIVATLEPNTGKEKIPLLLQKLLEERFKLSVGYESKTVQTYALTVGPGGPKFDKATEDSPVANYNLHGAIQGTKMPTGMLAELLTRQTGLPVVDETGLTGPFVIKLKWEPEETRANGNSDPMGPSIYTALQEQLGLKLVSKKNPVEYLVVQHAERVPTEN